jgi:hypothetical protein
LLACQHCVDDVGSRLAVPRSVAALVAQSSALLGRAARVLVPSDDAAARLRRHFPAVAPSVVTGSPALQTGGAARSARGSLALGRVCVLGAHSVETGYDTLLAIARDAGWRSLPIEFVLVGRSLDDGRLLATGRAFATGPAADDDDDDDDDDELVALIRRQGAGFALLVPAVPAIAADELDACWSAGLDVVALDIGTAAERIRRSGRGWLLPVGMSAPAINQKLLAIMRSIATAGGQAQA